MSKPKRCVPSSKAVGGGCRVRLSAIAPMAVPVPVLTTRILALPLMTVGNSLPRLAFAPLLIAWFGFGMSSKIALATSVVFFFMRNYGDFKYIKNSYQAKQQQMQADAAKHEHKGKK